jgi:hypothetical protein
MDDFWPDDIGKIASALPEELLEDQASKLGMHTNNLVLAEVARVIPEYGQYD